MRALRNMMGGLLCLCVAVSACHRGELSNGGEPPLPGPMAGWRVSFQEHSQDTRRVSFSPTEHAVAKEKMWALIVKDPSYLTASPRDLLETFRPRQICQKTNLTVIRQDYSDIVYEEQDAGCYKHEHSLTIGRIARGDHTVSFIAYHADVEELPPEKKANLIKYLNAAPLVVSQTKGPAEAPSASAIPQSSAGATGAP